MKHKATSKPSKSHRVNKHEPKRPAQEQMQDNSEEAIAAREREAGIKRL